MERRQETVFSKKVKAGKKRTYFIDVRTTRSNDYFLTITESRRRLNEEGYDKNKLFLYKEDFNKFFTALQETIEHVKEQLLPDFDFSTFDRQEGYDEGNSYKKSPSQVTGDGEINSQEPVKDDNSVADTASTPLPAEEQDQKDDVPTAATSDTSKGKDEGSPDTSPLLSDEGEKW